MSGFWTRQKAAGLILAVLLVVGLLAGFLTKRAHHESKSTVTQEGIAKTSFTNDQAAQTSGRSKKKAYTVL